MGQTTGPRGTRHTIGDVSRAYAGWYASYEDLVAADRLWTRAGLPTTECRALAKHAIEIGSAFMAEGREPPEQLLEWIEKWCDVSASMRSLRLVK
jgi:hypothetical protein